MEEGAKVFKQVLSELIALASGSIADEYDKGISKDSIVLQTACKAEEIIDGCPGFDALLEKGLFPSEIVLLKASLGIPRLTGTEQIINRLSSLKMKEFDKIDALDTEQRDAIRVIEKEKETLIEEAAHLGIFSRKRKKEIAALLNGIPDRINAVKEEFDRKKRRI